MNCLFAPAGLSTPSLEFMRGLRDRRRLASLGGSVDDDAEDHDAHIRPRAASPVLQRLRSPDSFGAFSPSGVHPLLESMDCTSPVHGQPSPASESVTSLALSEPEHASFVGQQQQQVSVQGEPSPDMETGFRRAHPPDIWSQRRPGYLPPTRLAPSAAAPTSGACLSSAAKPCSLTPSVIMCVVPLPQLSNPQGRLLKPTSIPV